MAHGGKRKGAGRKRGSGDRPSIFNYWSEKDIEEYYAHLKDNYKTSDKLAVWIGDHLEGKAPQAIDLTSGGKPLLIANDE